MIEETLGRQVKKALASLPYPSDLSVLIERPRDAKFGDFSCPVAFSIAKRLRKKPYIIAGEIISALELDSDEVEDVSIAGGGFINFTLSKRYFFAELGRIFDEGERYGRINVGKGKRVIVEFVSSNPTGPLTVGHGRQALLGDVLSNLLQEAGFQVTREYYFNDAGRQMDILGESCYARYMQEFDSKFGFPEEGYRGDYLVEIARKAVDAYGDRFVHAEGPARAEAVSTMRKFAASEIVLLIDRDLKELGVVFDSWFKESSLIEEGKVEEAVEKLDRSGAVYERDGALWFKASDYGDEEDRVLIKSSGDPTYFLTDIAYHINKYKRKYQYMINIHGADHHGYVPRMKAAMKALGFPENTLRYLVHQMVSFVEGGERMKMSTRAGAFVTLRELMEKVGVDSTRYFFVMRKADSHLVFDIDLARKRDTENPVYYVQYVHARVANVFERAKERGFMVSPERLRREFDSGKIRHESEWALIKLLPDFPGVVKSCALHLEPHRLTGYLEEVATAFHHWYQEGDKDQSRRMITDDPALTATRLYLAVCVKNIVSKGLKLLGVSRPERM